MEIRKIIDLGEYVVNILYNDVTGSIEVEILDELDEVIESISITNSDEDEDEIKFDPRLN
jgi:hypothetical protein